MKRIRKFQTMIVLLIVTILSCGSLQGVKAAEKAADKMEAEGNITGEAEMAVDAAAPGEMAGVKTADAGGKAAVKKVAEIVFLIDTSGSMETCYIENIGKNIEHFLEKIEKEEDAEVKIKLVRFDDTENVYGIRPCIGTYPTTGWYTNADIADAVKLLSFPQHSDFYPGYGDDSQETPLVALTDILKKDDYFTKSSDDTKVSKHIVLITDADYKQVYAYNNMGDAGYVDTFEGKTEVEIKGKKSIVEELAKQKIKMSVITQTAYYPKYIKFQTEPTAPGAYDGGLLADISGDFGVIFENLAEKVIIPDLKSDVNSMTGRKPIKIMSNMVVLKKDTDCKYKVHEGNIKFETDADKAEWAKVELQDSCVFKGLKPATEYTFLVLKQKDGAGDYDVLHDRYVLTTEKMTCAHFGKIPEMVYEGEVYNIKLTEQMAQLMATADAEITWSCTSNCVAVVKKEQGYQMEIVDCPYDRDKPIKVTLEASILYTEKQNNGTFVKKTKKYTQKFAMKNKVDSIELEGISENSYNYYRNGIICLGTKDRVSMNVILNQGEMADVATDQKLVYYISDAYGNANKSGAKIASVSSKGVVKGVAPGVTYISVAAKESYNSLIKNYEFSVTIPVVCQEVTEIEFDEDALEKMCTVEERGIQEKEWQGKQDVIVVKKKSKVDLRQFLVYNTTSGLTNIFNSEKMKQEWISTNKSVVSVNTKGIITAKNPGYAMIIVTPTGGFKISALTGKRDAGIIPCSAFLLVQVVE